MLDNHIAIGPCIDRDLAQRCTQSATHNLDPGALITVQLISQPAQGSGQLDQRAATAGHNAFFNSGSGGIQGIFDPQFAVLELGFRRSSDLDHGHTAGEFGDALVELLAVVLGIGVLQFPADGRHALSDGITAVFAGDDGGFFLADGDAADPAEILQRHLVERHRSVFADHGSTGEDGNVREGGFAALAKGGCADSSHLKHAAVFVHHQGCQGLSIDFLGQNHQGRSCFLNRLKNRHEISHGTDLAIGQQQQGIFELTDLTITIGDEIRRAVTPVEGHSFGHLQLRGQRLGFLHGDHPIDGDLVHGFSHHATNFFIASGTHCGHLTDGISTDGLAALSETFDDQSDRFLHAATELDRAGTGCGVA